MNRRGDVTAEVDVVYEIDLDPKKQDDPFEKCRWRTLEMLRRLPVCIWNSERREASPLELGRLTAKLTEDERKAAFSPQPIILPTSDILFDASRLRRLPISCQVVRPWKALARNNVRAARHAYRLATGGGSDSARGVRRQIYRGANRRLSPQTT